MFSQIHPSSAPAPATGTPGEADVFANGRLDGPPIEALPPADGPPGLARRDSRGFRVVEG